jgi:hypothetical protein
VAEGVPGNRPCQFAVAWGFCSSPPALFDLIDRELAMLWKLEQASVKR